jgi:hypothetical protein
MSSFRSQDEANAVPQSAQPVIASAAMARGELDRQPGRAGVAAGKGCLNMGTAPRRDPDPTSGTHPESAPSQPSPSSMRRSLVDR